MKRRKIVTLPSPTHQGSQTWCTASIPGIYCGVGVRVISVVFYTCHSHWFRLAIAALVRFTKAGVGNWKWGSHRVIVPIGTSHKSLRTSRGCRNPLAGVQPDHNERMVLPFLSEVETVEAMCFLCWYPPPQLAIPSNWTSYCRNVDESRCSSL